MKRLLLLALVLMALPSPLLAAVAEAFPQPNGLRLIVESDEATDIVAIDLLLDISAEDEPARQAGIRALTQRLLMRGTTNESGESMARRLAAVGGVADASAGLDYVEIYAVVPSDGFEVALELLADAVRNPAFSPEAVDRQKVAAVEAADAFCQDPFQETYLAFREGFYRSHPYARPTFGEPASLDSITRQDIVAFHAAYYLPGKAVLAICGGVDQVRARRAVRSLLGNWGGGEAPPRPEATVAPLASSELVARELPTNLAYMVLGFPAPLADAPHYYAMQLIDGLLTGGSRARLPRALRDQRSLAYHVSSFYPTLREPSHLAIYTATDRQHLDLAKAAVLDVLTDLRQEPVPEEELARTKRHLIGSYLLSHQRMKDQAFALAWYELLGLGSDFEERYAASLQAVTPAQVQEAAQTFLQRFVLAITLPTG